MKRILAIVVMMLFVVSMVPLAIAEETTDESTDEQDDTMQKREEAKRVLKHRAGEIKDKVRDKLDDRHEEFMDKAKERVEERKEEFKIEAKERLREKRNELIKDAKGQARAELKDVRHKIKEKFKELEFSREGYLKIKDRHKKALENHKEYAKELRKLSDLAKCNEESEECQEKKRGLRKGVGTHLGKKIDVIERALEKLTGKVEAAEGLSDDEKAAAIEQIASLVDTLAKQKEAIEALEDPSNEELKAQMQDLKATWKDVKDLHKRLVAALTISKVDAALDRHQDFLQSMQDRIDASDNSEELQALKDKFAAHIERLELRRDSLEQQGIAAVESGSFREFKQTQQELRESFRESKQHLREFIKANKDTTSEG